MPRKIALTLFAIVGLINFALVLGVLSAERLSAAYGVAVEDPNLAILLRHRAVLFGIVGGTMLVSLYRASLRRYAVVAGAISMVTFIAIVLRAPSYNGQIANVLTVDVVACVLFAAALVIDREALLPPPDRST